ncbi:MAG: transposase [Nitrososphaeria archaeon]
MLMYNIKINASPFTKEFIKTLRELNDYKINGYLNVLEVLNKEIEDISNRIKEIANDNEDAKLLMSIPGISFYSALFILSEIGDINRFPDSEHLVSYAGLAPSTRSSGIKVYHGPITKQGSSYLRWILTQVTWANIRKEPNGTVGNFYSKLKKKKGSAKAIVAASAKMLRIIYCVLKEQRPYQS